jgi:hypothetical protein
MDKRGFNHEQEGYQAGLLSRKGLEAALPCL